MKIGYNFEFFGNYIQVRHSENFVITPPEMMKFWTELAEFSKQHNCKKVMVDGTIGYRKMSTVEAFESGSIAGRKVLGVWLAFYFPDYKPDQITEFFKTVARNRGVRIDFFTDREIAFKWLSVLENVAAA